MEFASPYAFVSVEGGNVEEMSDEEIDSIQE